MTLIDDARRFLQPGLHEEPNDGAIPYPSYLYCRGEMARGHHAEDCPWPRRERILAVLEAVERLLTAENAMPFYATPIAHHPWSSSEWGCYWCGRSEDDHQSDCPWQALEAALEGEGSER